jgi:hypothetical protein
VGYPNLVLPPVERWVRPAQGVAWCLENFGLYLGLVFFKQAVGHIFIYIFINWLRYHRRLLRMASVKFADSSGAAAPLGRWD